MRRMNWRDAAAYRQLVKILIQIQVPIPDGQFKALRAEITNRVLNDIQEQVYNMKLKPRSETK